MADRSALSFPLTPLLRCPFCGNVARWFRTGRDVGVECTSVDTGGCPGCAQTDVYAPEHADDAAHQWNRRPDSRESATAVQLLVALKSAKHMLERDYIDPAKYAVIKKCELAIGLATGSAA